MEQNRTSKADPTGSAQSVDQSPPSPSPTIKPIRRLAKVARTIRTKGRVAGFESMRDLLLNDWESFSALMNPYSALKLVLETDRHAMFAQVAMEKTRGTEDKTLWTEYREYLRGNIDVVPNPSGDAEAAAIAAPSSQFDAISTPPNPNEDDDGEEDDE